MLLGFVPFVWYHTHGSVAFIFNEGSIGMLLPVDVRHILFLGASGDCLPIILLLLAEIAFEEGSFILRVHEKCKGVLKSVFLGEVCAIWLLATVEALL